MWHNNVEDLIFKLTTFLIMLSWWLCKLMKQLSCLMGPEMAVDVKV
jgi:hypothetical protein